MSDTTPTPAPAGVPLYTDEYLDGEKHRHIDMLHSGARTYMDWDCITLIRAKQMRDEYEAELAKLRRQLAEQWTPLPDGKHDRIAKGTTIEIRADMVILENRDSILTAVFPDNLRLCRKPKESTE